MPTQGQLVKYIGLNPAFDDSGKEKWSGGIGGHGRKDLRCLLIEGAQAILRCSKTPLAQWGKKLLARKGQINLVVAAIARKLTVAVWYLLMGRWTPLEEIDAGWPSRSAKSSSGRHPETGAIGQNPPSLAPGNLSLTHLENLCSEPQQKIRDRPLKQKRKNAFNEKILA